MLKSFIPSILLYCLLLISSCAYVSDRTHTTDAIDTKEGKFLPIVNMESGFIYNHRDNVKVIRSDNIDDPANTVLVIFNHGLSGIYEKSCNQEGNIVHISKLSGQKINGKEIKVFMNCEHSRVGGKFCERSEFMNLEEFVGDKPLCGNAVYFNRKQATVNLVKKFIDMGVLPENIFTMGHSWGGWNALRIAAFNDELIKASIALMPACCDIKRFQEEGSLIAKEFQYFAYQLKSATTINTLVLSSPGDPFETPKSLKFLESIDGVQFMELPGSCPGARDGHGLMWSSCFIPYVAKIKNYMEDMIEHDRFADALVGIDDGTKEIATLAKNEAAANKAPPDATSSLSALDQMPRTEPLPQDELDKEGEPRTVFMAHLASYRKIEGAKNGWEQLATQHGAILNYLSREISRVLIPNKGIFYRIEVGPFASIKEAKELCLMLNEHKTYCHPLKRIR